MFISKKRHFRELSEQKDYYENLLTQVSNFHQEREHKISALLGSYFDRFSNKSATKCINEIRDSMIIEMPPEESKNGSSETI